MDVLDIYDTSNANKVLGYVEKYLALKANKMSNTCSSWTLVHELVTQALFRIMLGNC